MAPRSYLNASPCGRQPRCWPRLALPVPNLFVGLYQSRQILAADHPRQHKALGRKVKPFDVAVWKRECVAIVRAGNHAKFTQNPELLDKLLATKGTTLVEASPYDKIWGIGLAASDPRAKDPAQWKGQNLLGKILTELRDQLLAERA